MLFMPTVMKLVRKPAFVDCTATNMIAGMVVVMGGRLTTRFECDETSVPPRLLVYPIGMSLVKLEKNVLVTEVPISGWIARLVMVIV